MYQSFKAPEIEISNEDIDIAHRIPTRSTTSGPWPIVCKFTRRIVKEQVMNARNEACKVLATSIGLPSSHSLENVRLFHHLTPLLQQLLADSKKFQKRNGCYLKSNCKHVPANGVVLTQNKCKICTCMFYLLGRWQEKMWWAL